MTLTDHDVERVVLGSLLTEDAAWDALEGVIFPEVFSDPLHRAVAESAWSLKRRGKPTDPVSVAAHSKDASQTHAFDLGATISLQGYSTTVDALWTHHGALLRSLWAKRQRRQIAQDILADDSDGPVEEKLARDAARILGVETGSTKKARPATEILLERMEALEAEAKAGPDSRKLSLVDTGLPALDRLIQGMRPGEPVMFAARPGMGKSSIAVTIAEHCGRLGIPVGMFWLEDHSSSLATRILARRAIVPTALLKHGSSLRAEHWASLTASVESSASWPIFIDDAHGLTAAQIGQRMRRMHREHGVRVFIVDHLGEVRLDDSSKWGGRHDLAMGEALRTFRDVAADLKAVPICMAQLGRENERADGANKLSHIFGTGIAEQVVRIAVFLSRTGNTVNAEVVKNTNGPLGTCQLAWEGDTMAITNAKNVASSSRPMVRMVSHNDDGED